MIFVGIKFASIIFASFLISIAFIGNSQGFADHFLFKFGSEGSSPGQFKYPNDIVVDYFRSTQSLQRLILK